MDTIFINAVAAWYLAIDGKEHPALPQQLEAQTEEQYESWCISLGAAKIAANKAGHACQFNKGGAKTRRYCWIKSGPHTLKIVFSQKARAQAVTQTSKAAYHSLDFTTQRGLVAQIIFERSSRGLDVTRKEIEALYKLPSNVVTGRVNELLKLSAEAPFEFNGKLYTLTTTKPRLSVCPGASPVKNEGLMWVEASDIKLFVDPAYNKPEGAQTSLFQ